jgi:hypothetical protein
MLLSDDEVTDTLGFEVEAPIIRLSPLRRSNTP